MSFMDNFKAWFKQPYSDDMDVLHWFLFFGLLIAISVGWHFILRTASETA